MPSPPPDHPDHEELATKPRILVVDDNRDSAESLASLLTILGHEVRTAFDGAGALQHPPGWNPEIVFLDIALPGMNGYDVARALRAGSPSPLLLIALTGYDRPEDRARSRAAGFDHHLVKPIGIDVLRSVLVRNNKKGGGSGAAPLDV